VIPDEKKWILVVEDQQLVSDSLMMVLKHDGYEVDVAANGREGAALFQPQKYVLILTDYDMPEMNGYDFASFVKDRDAGQPIILITAYFDLENSMPSLPVDLVLEKPWSIDELRTAIRKVLPA
jgi:DNA-binding response OmpR family regulator